MATPTKKPAASEPQGPVIYEYEDYRAYLKAIYEFRNRGKEKFSLRMFGKEAGFSSPNYLKMVMDGDRRLGPEGIRKFIKGLGLKSKEREFFENLVRFNQTESDQDKARYFERMQRNKRYKEIKQLESDQYNYFSHWHNAAIRELIEHPDFKEDPQWIAQTLCPSIKPEQAAEALELLKRLKMIEYNDEGRLMASESIVASAPQVYSVALANFHQQMLHRASDSVTKIAPKLRDMTSITFALSEKDFADIKKRITQFRRSLLSAYDPKSQAFDRVYQMNFSLFPLSDKIKKK